MMLACSIANAMFPSSLLPVHRRLILVLHVECRVRRARVKQRAQLAAQIAQAKAQEVHTAFSM